MTNIRIIFDSADSETEIFCGNQKIENSNSRVYDRLTSDGFYKCLNPFRSKYMIWNGLIAELISEVNDSELEIVFVGDENDFDEVRKAFDNSGEYISAMGYEDKKWSLQFEKKRDNEKAREELKRIAENLLPKCETEKEKKEVYDLISKIAEEDISDVYKKTENLLQRHIKKWQKSHDKFKTVNIFYIKTQHEQLKMVLKIIEKEKRRNG